MVEGGLEHEELARICPSRVCSCLCLTRVPFNLAARTGLTRSRAVCVCGFIFSGFAFCVVCVSGCAVGPRAGGPRLCYLYSAGCRRGPAVHLGHATWPAVHAEVAGGEPVVRLEEEQSWSLSDSPFAFEAVEERGEGRRVSAGRGGFHCGGGCGASLVGAIGGGPAAPPGAGVVMSE